MKEINYKDVGFEFEKIGRALNEDYYFYNGAVIVCDDKQFVFQKTSMQDWQSLGKNGYRVFKDSLQEGILTLINFGD